MKQYIAIGMALVAVIIAIGAYMHSSNSVTTPGFGGTTNYDEVDASAFKSGASGNRFGNFVFGFQNCVLIDGASVTATTTKALDCAVTGVVAGDFVVVAPATTTTSGSQLGWKIVGANASSTSGFVTVKLQNDTGANAVPASTATTTSVLIIHPLSSVPGL